MALDRKQRIPYAAAAGFLGAALLLLTAAPAFAKGAMDITVPTHHVRAGRPVHVSGKGDDDAGRFLRACVQERGGDHGAWHTVGCGRVMTSGAGARVEADVRPAHGGVLQLRGVLYGLSDRDDPHPEELRSSPVTSVSVR
ncbi:hypothetical protein ACFY1P_13440 [Streptomyces sp. NPDC001407]|uniref:hypothetical protein n=1 Tax=unclassified Streptomyces TaxID=2593676 RepID=UPI0033E69F91